MRFTKFLAIAAVALSLGACAQTAQFIDKVQTAVEKVADVKVDRNAVALAVDAYDASALTAAAYLRLPICRTGGTAICRDPKNTQVLKRALLAGREARNQLLDFLERNPGQLGPKGVYDALVSATNLIGKIAG